MLLHTPLYLLFLLILIPVYWLLQIAHRKVILLVASAIFYASLDIRFLVLLAVMIFVNYFIGQAIPKSSHARQLVWLSVAVNLGILAVFKWANFYIESLRLFLQSLGVSSLPTGIQLLFPIGISFFSFQAIAYIIEVSKKKIKPATLLDFSIYMAFFPKLIAGPLVRPDNFLGQLKHHPVRPDRNEIQGALRLLLLGLVKKIVLADSLASLSEVAFRAAARETGAFSFPSFLYWQGFYLYSFMIYADFSGYTDIARASASLLGFELPENFRQPYLSENMIAFWNRWHISLTQWFRVYLFFPLSRWFLEKTERQYSRLIQITVTLITMFLIGIWHGAGWTFAIWGLWHGLLLIINQQWKPTPTNRWLKLGLGFITFHLVGVGWVLFGSNSFAAAGRFFSGMLALNNPIELGFYLPPVLLSAALLFSIDLVQSQNIRLPTRIQTIAKPILAIAGIVVLIGLTMIYQAHGGDSRPFIYGQF